MKASSTKANSEERAGEPGDAMLEKYEVVVVEDPEG